MSDIRDRVFAHSLQLVNQGRMSVVAHLQLRSSIEQGNRRKNKEEPRSAADFPEKTALCISILTELTLSIPSLNNSSDLS